MKKFTLLFALVTMALTLLSQTPQGFKYQAVVRDNSGEIIANQAIGLKIAILEESATGTVIYVETHSLMSNAYGLINAVVGHGDVTEGDFEAINWGANAYFIQIAMDVEGGTNYDLMGTTQLFAVPYALYSSETENVEDADADPGNELLQNAFLNGTNLKISDNSGTHTVDFADLLMLTSPGGNRFQIGVNDEGNLITIPIKAKIVSISDPHLMDPSLMVSYGSAFEQYLAGDRKLLMESEAVFEFITDAVIAENPDILIVPGDLTKDGELVSHEGVAGFLSEIEAEGIKVFVCPGNHDVNNPHAFSFDGDTVYSVPTVTPEEFATVHSDFGYAEALYTDESSLSYIAEPIDGIWILSMDVCKYDENNTHPETGGAFKEETLQWVIEKLQEAETEGKLVLGMQHHGITEHYLGQTTFFPEYVIEDYETVSAQLADAGLKVVFTGHYHANDIVAVSSQKGNLYDIETGSTVTYPCPYRVMYLTEDNKLQVKTRRIESIDYPVPGGQQFQVYAMDFVYNGIYDLSIYMLTNPPYNLDQPTAEMMAPLMASAFVAHYQGDEGNPIPEHQAIIDMLINSGDPMQVMLGQAIMAIWTDIPPADNNVTIDLETGTLE